MSHSWPMARHCMPQNATHQIARIALRSAAPVKGGFGPERVGRVPSAAITTSSASTASMKASTSENASHEAGEVLAGVKAGSICCGSGGCWRWPPTYLAALPSVSPHSPQSSIMTSTGWHDPSANRFSRQHLNRPHPVQHKVGPLCRWQADGEAQRETMPALAKDVHLGGDASAA